MPTRFAVKKNIHLASPSLITSHFQIAFEGHGQMHPSTKIKSYIAVFIVTELAGEHLLGLARHQVSDPVVARGGHMTVLQADVWSISTRHARVAHPL